MKTRISALMDGELDEHEAEEVFRALGKDAALRAQWDEFHRVGAALRREPMPDVELTARVMAALDEEPTVLVPSAHRKAIHLRPLMALAASAAGVALVAWVALDTPSSQSLEPIRGNATSQLVSSPAERVAPLAVAAAASESIRLQDYLLAHHAHAPAAAVATGTHYVRIVSVAREGR